MRDARLSATDGGFLWSPEDDARLRSLVAGPARTWAQIADLFGVSDSAVKARAGRLGLRKGRAASRGKYRAWMQSDDRRLSDMRAAGLTAGQIAQALGVSPAAVRSRCAYLSPRGALAAVASARRAQERLADVWSPGNLCAANAAHLADLRRHHLPASGELQIGRDGYAAARMFPAGFGGSPGSPAALCAEA